MLFVAIAAMMCASCGKENTTDNVTPASDNSQEPSVELMIVGHWNETEILYIMIQNGESDTSSMLEEGEFTEMTFNADKTYTSIYHAHEGDAEGEGTWSVNGDSITITDEFGPMDYHIDQLDKEVFNITYTEEGEDEDGPYTINIKSKMTKN